MKPVSYYIVPLSSKSKSFKCIICNKTLTSDRIQRREDHVMNKHFKTAIYWNDDSEAIFQCKCSLYPNNSHYHCSKCNFIGFNQSDMKNHLLIHSETAKVLEVIVPKNFIDLSTSVDNADVPSEEIINIDDNFVAEDFDDIPGPRKRNYECTIEGCSKTFQFISSAKRHESTHSAASIQGCILKNTLVDAAEQIYLVRKTSRGSDYMVHVNLKEGSCRNSDCIASASINPNEILICRHARSAQSNDSSACDFHSITTELIESSTLSQTAKVAIVDLKNASEEELKPLIAEFSEDKTKFRNFSVYSTNSERAYVKCYFTDRNGQLNQAWSCDICSDNLKSNCVHIHCAMIITIVIIITIIIITVIITIVFIITIIHHSFYLKAQFPRRWYAIP